MGVSSWRLSRLYVVFPGQDDKPDLDLSDGKDTKYLPLLLPGHDFKPDPTCPIARTLKTLAEWYA